MTEIQLCRYCGHIIDGVAKGRCTKCDLAYRGGYMAGYQAGQRKK